MTTSLQRREHALFSTAIGSCGIAWQGDIIVATTLPEASEAATRSLILQRAKSEVEAKPPPAINDAIAAITALLAGARTDLSHLACDLGPDDEFNTRVFRVALAIPPGQTQTYGDVATRLGDERLAQAVGRALGRNHLPIIVPCHRVLGANGKLTGFSATGGVATKLRMLEIEGAMVGETAGLFDLLPLAVKPNASARRDG